jgi:hypothetical protein
VKDKCNCPKDNGNYKRGEVFPPCPLHGLSWVSVYMPNINKRDPRCQCPEPYATGMRGDEVMTCPIHGMKENNSLPDEVRAAIEEVRLMRPYMRNRDSLGRQRKSSYARFIERISLFFKGPQLPFQEIIWKDMCNQQVLKDISEDNYIRLCKQSVPDDFYFCTVEHDPAESNYHGNKVHIVPREWFYHTGNYWHGILHLGHIIPKYLRNYMAGTFSTDVDVQDITRDMLEKGFRQHPYFTDLCNGVGSNVN